MLTNSILLPFLIPDILRARAELIEEDHTLSILDAMIMSVIFLLLIILLVTYGSDGTPVGSQPR